MNLKTTQATRDALRDLAGDGPRAVRGPALICLIDDIETGIATARELDGRVRLLRDAIKLALAQPGLRYTTIAALEAVLRATDDPKADDDTKSEAE